MRTAKGIISFVGAVGDTINFNACNFHILGSSIPTMMEKGKSYGHVSITLPTEKQKALIFFTSSRDNEEVFLKFCRKATGEAWAYPEEELIPPCEMVVSGEAITIKTSDDKLVSTNDKPGAYKVTHDAMCQFLIRDITEEELLAEAVKLEEESIQIESLYDRIDVLIDKVTYFQELSDDLREKVARQEKQLKASNDFIDELRVIADESCWSSMWNILTMEGSRLLRFRKELLWEKRTRDSI